MSTPRLSPPTPAPARPQHPRNHCSPERSTPASSPNPTTLHLLPLSPPTDPANPSLSSRNARLHGRRLRMGRVVRQQRLGPPAQVHRPDPAHRLPLLPQQAVGGHERRRLRRHGASSTHHPFSNPTNPTPFHPRPPTPTSSATQPSKPSTSSAARSGKRSPTPKSPATTNCACRTKSTRTPA